MRDQKELKSDKLHDLIHPCLYTMKTALKEQKACPAQLQIKSREAQVLFDKLRKITHSNTHTQIHTHTHTRVIVMNEHDYTRE